MPLDPGARLGGYQVLSLIGSGGMGEVYRAADTALNRHVAIKVLAQAVATDPERLARLQREAEVLALLNHPNIAHIHGIERSDGTFALRTCRLSRAACVTSPPPNSREDWRCTICAVEHDVLSRIRDLLSTARVLSLAVIVEGQAEAALLPFVARDDFGAVHVQASSLARHARGLTAGARVGLLVHRPDAAEADPMQLPRLTVQAVVSILDKGTGQFAAAAARFAERFPTAGMTLSLEDFSLYELMLERGRYVEGFARAFNVGPHTFTEIAAL